MAESAAHHLYRYANDPEVDVYEGITEAEWATFVDTLDYTAPCSD